MKQNKKILIATSLAMLVSLAVAGTAFADTTSGTAAAPHTRAHGGQMMGGVKPAVAGKVTAINGNTLTITTEAHKGKNGTETAAETYTVDITSAKITKGFGTSVTTLAASTIAVNDFVAVEGTVSGTSVTATSVMERGQMTPMTPPTAVGKVIAISGNSITVTAPARKDRKTGTETATTTYTVDATNAKITKGFGANAAVLPVSNIAVNDIVVVQGTTSGTNITASSIIDGIEFTMKGRGKGGAMHGQAIGSSGNMLSTMTHVMGTVSSISGSNLVVAEGNSTNTTNYTVDATNAKVSYGKNIAGTLASISVGDKVFVLAPKVASGVTSVTATAIHDSTKKS